MFLGFPCGSAGTDSTCSAGDLGSIPGLGRSPGEGKHHPFQYSGLENSMDWLVHGDAKSRTRLNNSFHFTLGSLQTIPGETHPMEMKDMINGLRNEQFPKGWPWERSDDSSQVCLLVQPPVDWQLNPTESRKNQRKSERQFTGPQESLFWSPSKLELRKKAEQLFAVH